MFTYVVWLSFLYFFFVFKQKTAYEMRISDWSSDVCSSDLCDRWCHDRAAYSSWLKPGCPPRTGTARRLRSSWPPSRETGNFAKMTEIGRASCRERVCQYV